MRARDRHASLPLAWTIALVAGLACSPPVSPTPPDTSATAGPTTRPTADNPVPEPKPKTVELAEYGFEHVGVVLPGEDICEKNPDGSLKNPIEAGKYQGLLRNAKCEQQKFLTMARVAKALGVECNHCHLPHPTDPKKEDYPKFTEKKRIANWMFKTFVQGLRPKDGSKMMCASCHTSRKTGKPVAKILGEPRDQDFAQVWMHEVMTTAFVERNRKRLKCKTCHVGVAPNTDGWIQDVIRRLRYEGKVQRRDDLADDTGE
jgi:hypothetical protein